jgi:hypothetical protein
VPSRPTLITIELVPTRQAPRRPKARVFLEGENQSPPALDLQEESRYEGLGAARLDGQRLIEKGFS